MTDRQTDDRQTDRQTENSSPSVPYDTFGCFTGLIMIIIKKIDLSMRSSVTCNSDSSHY